MHASTDTHRHGSRLRIAGVTAVLVLAAVLSPALAPAQSGARSSLGGTLSGTTSQGNPARITVARSGRKIRQLSITIEIHCGFGPLLVPQRARSLTIARSGRFAGRLEHTESEEEVVLNFRESVSGRFNADRTSARVRSRVHIEVHAPDGSSEACDSGVVTLHATR